MKKKDVILLVLLLGAAAAAVLFLLFSGRQEAQRIVVTVDGAVFGTYSLFEERTVDVENAFGHNRIVIENGSAYMEAADCPDKYCMTYKPVSRTNESIICLPHRLVVRAEGTKSTGIEQTELDGIAQ